MRSLLQSVKYTALAGGAVDVIDGYSTDGLMARHGLVVLEDDRGLFPPYEAAALVSARLPREVPAAVLALTRLSGRLDVQTMRVLNRRVEVDDPKLPRHLTEADRHVVGVTEPADGEGTLGADRAALEEHLGLCDHAAPALQDLAHRHRARSVQDDTERAVLVDVEQQDDRVGEVRVNELRRRDQQHARLRRRV